MPPQTELSGESACFRIRMDHHPDHGSGLTTLYAHMYPHTVRVQKGDYVERGQRIASVGSNGYSTGPHNHFEVRKQGRLQNPLKYLK